MNKLEYFMKEKGLSSVAATVLVGKLEKYNDISDEFDYWVSNRHYKKENTVVVEGYTANMISEIAPALDASGVYSFLVTLRDNPDSAKQIISEKFPQK